MNFTSPEVCQQSVDEILTALEDAKQKRKRRLNDNSDRRRKARLKARLDSSDFMHDDQFHPVLDISIHTSPTTEACCSTHDYVFLDPPLITNCQENIVTDDVLSSDIDDLTFEDLMMGNQPNNDHLLHPYTSIHIHSFSRRILRFIRQTNLSKNHTKDLIDLVQSALPQPNFLVKNYANLLEMLSGEMIHIPQ